jgi:hypothetical protein
MLEQTILDTLIVIGIFVLRIGVPVTILFGLAKWLEKKVRPQETQETERRTASARIIPFTKPQSATRTLATRPVVADEVKRANIK